MMVKQASSEYKDNIKHIYRDAGAQVMVKICWAAAAPAY